MDQLLHFSTAGQALPVIETTPRRARFVVEVAGEAGRKKVP